VFHGAVIPTYRYLNDYVDHFGFRDRIRLGATVKSAELMNEGSWLIRYEWKRAEMDTKDMALVTKKLVLETGTTSKPHMPKIAGTDKFGVPLFHSMELANRTADMSAAKNIVVLGVQNLRRTQSI
jgi:cation diffusion facilitator CzcD-associated flavoprotein CzcO